MYKYQLTQGVSFLFKDRTVGSEYYKPHTVTIHLSSDSADNLLSAVSELRNNLDGVLLISEDDPDLDTIRKVYEFGGVFECVILSVPHTMISASALGDVENGDWLSHELRTYFSEFEFPEKNQGVEIFVVK